MKPQKISIIGAGIIGSALAWRLSQAGAKVTLIDPNPVGGIASAASFGWINATYENPRAYYDLRVFSMNKWQHIKAEFPDLPYTQNGTLYLDFYGIALETVHTHSHWGYDLEWATCADIKALEPNINHQNTRALLNKTEALIEPDIAARYFANMARELGANCIQTSAVRFKTQGSKITAVHASDGDIETDHAIIAAGSATQSLAQTLDLHLPMDSPAGLLIHTKPTPKVIHRTILTDGLHMQQRPNGTITAGGDFGGGSLNDDPITGSALLFERLKKALKTNTPVEFSHHTLGLRPTPQDGMPILGLPQGFDTLTIATMHSGATLAPGVASLLSDQIINRQTDPLLAPFSPNRFLEMRQR